MPANFTFGSSPVSSMTAFGGSTERDIFKQFYPKYPAKPDVLSGTPAATTPSTAVNAAANAVAGIPVSPGTTPAVTPPTIQQRTSPYPWAGQGKDWWNQISETTRTMVEGASPDYQDWWYENVKKLGSPVPEPKYDYAAGNLVGLGHSLYAGANIPQYGQAGYIPEWEWLPTNPEYQAAKSAYDAAKTKSISDYYSSIGDIMGYEDWMSQDILGKAQRTAEEQAAEEARQRMLWTPPPPRPSYSA